MGGQDLVEGEGKKRVVSCTVRDLEPTMCLE